MITFAIGACAFYVPRAFDPRWIPTQPVLVIMLVVVLLQVWSSPMWSFVQARSPAHWPIRAVLAATAFELAFGYVGVKLAGIQGAALVILSSNLLLMLLYLSEMRRQFPTAPNFFQPFWMKLAVNTALAGGGLVAFTSREWTTVSGLVACSVLLALSCAVSLFATQEDRALVARIASTALGFVRTRTV